MAGGADRLSVRPVNIAARPMSALGQKRPFSLGRSNDRFVQKANITVNLRNLGVCSRLLPFCSRY
jgi:hypothetical protein